MPKNSNAILNSTAAKNSSMLWRIVLGFLVAANVAAIWFVLNPVGGSPEQLEQQLTTLKTQVAAKSAILKRARTHVIAVEKGRTQGDQFLDSFFLARRTAYSTLLTELLTAADQAQIKPREHAYSTDPIEGSDNLSMMTITANYEGTYSNLMRFVNAVDRSPRLLIIEGLTAAPQQNGGMLSVNMKIDAFVREDGSGDLAPIDVLPTPAVVTPPPAATSSKSISGQNTANRNFTNAAHKEVSAP
jgi:Tfp pilus assembly protein PilO